MAIQDRVGSSMNFILILLVFKFVRASIDNGYILKTKHFPKDDRFRPSIGNGHIATNVLSDTVYMNGLYNGLLEKSHRARIPASMAVDVTSFPGMHSRMYELDMKNGMFVQEILGSSCAVTVKYFAHRRYTRLLVTHLTVKRTSATNDLRIKLEVNSGEASQDLNISQPVINGRRRYITGHNIDPETATMGPSSFTQYSTVVDSVLMLPAGQASATFVFFAAISRLQEEAFLAYQMADSVHPSHLLASHVQEWNNIWNKGRIEISGNLPLQQTINAALYHILSSTPLLEDSTNPFIGLSPGGLSRGGLVAPKNTSSHNDYLGHVFWDMDTWIMPPLMMLHPDVGRILLAARTRVLDVVKQHANDTGYDGVRFPWEQAVTGQETCPWQLASDYQIHVTADVAYSLRQYLYATKDTGMLLERNGKKMAFEIAKFWKSRSMKMGDKSYGIFGVMGPDEYHFNINNSVFTNYNAKLSLMLPHYLMDSVEIIMTQEEKKEVHDFVDVANNMEILYDKDRKFHPQFDGMSTSEKIKQSDAVLLGYPLLMPMTAEVRRNDLQIYEKMTDEFGPDTGTWSMHAVAWLELGEPERAASAFKMMFRNINGPFKIFSEKPASSSEGVRCVNFITGAGGLLQSVIFGYGGIRLRMHRLDINPYLLPNVTSWAIRNLDYRGSSLDIFINQSHITITVTQRQMSAEELYLMNHEKQISKLHLKQGVSLKRSLLSLCVYSELPVLVKPTTKPSISTSSSGFKCPNVIIFIIAVFALLDK